MARVPSKHGSDQALDFQGFLNDLQDWELSLKDKDKKLKPHVLDKQNLDHPVQRGSVKNGTPLSSGPGISGKQGQKRVGGGSSPKIAIVGEDRKPVGKNSLADYPSTTRQYDYSKNYDPMNNFPSSFVTEESSPDAASEKELGNEYFKQKKFKEAIDCYSRSIALSPTAVAYANRAMAYLKIRRFQEAEDDCTEALNLDDRYIKAYSRRATARKELGKFKESIEDAEFAMRLEPLNQEVKKQHAEAKSLYEKEILKKASGVLKRSVKGVQNAEKSKTVQPVSVSSARTQLDPIQNDHARDSDGQVLDTSMSAEETDLNNMRTKTEEMDAFREGATQGTGGESVKRNHRTSKQELAASLQELASRVASRATADTAKNIRPPKSAYEFEVSWRGFSGDCALQARLLMATPPAALPQIFKNALSASILTDIIKCIATFFGEEMDLAVKYLENLTKVSRFDTIVMCLSSTDKADLVKLWDEVFCSNATPMEYTDILSKLRPKYCH